LNPGIHKVSRKPDRAATDKTPKTGMLVLFINILLKDLEKGMKYFVSLHPVST
jgi:hypothetical protein